MEEEWRKREPMAAVRRERGKMAAVAVVMAVPCNDDGGCGGIYASVRFQ
jgi:hypothetical protein